MSKYTLRGLPAELSATATSWSEFDRVWSVSATVQGDAGEKFTERIPAWNITVEWTLFARRAVEGGGWQTEYVGKVVNVQEEE